MFRSSMEGEDDSDPCASYPYMQFELNNPNRATLPISMCSRRHSLPVQTEAFVRLLNTPMTNTNNDEPSSRQHSNGQSNCHPSVPSQHPGLAPNFVRQYSFGERRRSLRQPQFVSTEPQYIPGGMRPLATNRRRLFAGVRAPMISAVESLSSSSSSGSGSVGGGSVEKGNAASFDHDTPFTANANVAADYNSRLVSGHINRGANLTSLNINDSKEHPPLGYNDTNFLSKSEHQNQHRSVTFQVSRSSESSDTSKDDFQLELDPFKNLATENDFNSPEQHNSSPRRGSAPCNLLINQINANYLRMVANSVPLNGNDRNENEQIISQNQEEDYFEENTTQSSRRGSLPVNLKSYNLNSNNTLNNTTEQEFDNCSTTNKEYRLNYAAKRRQMAHCKKLLDRNSSFNDEMLPPAGRPPMLSQNASLRSSSFGGIGENGNYNEQPNDNFLRFLPATSPAAARSTNDNMDNFAHLLMYRRASAPIHRQSSLSRVPGKDPRASFTVLDDENMAIHQHTRENTNINVGAVTERFGNHQSSPAAQPVNYNSTPSLSTLLARERIHAVQSTMQLLHNNEDPSLQGTHHHQQWDPSKMSPNSNNSSAKLFLMNDVVNNCINDVNRSSFIDGSISTTNSNSASIRRGSLPTDFHFYNSFGVC